MAKTMKLSVKNTNFVESFTISPVICKWPKGFTEIHGKNFAIVIKPKGVKRMVFVMSRKEIGVFVKQIIKLYFKGLLKWQK